jgi:hypothetical protein
MANIDSVTKNKLTIKADSLEKAHKLKVLIIGFSLVLLSGCLHPAVMIFAFGILIFVFFHAEMTQYFVPVQKVKIWP